MGAEEGDRVVTRRARAATAVLSLASVALTLGAIEVALRFADRRPRDPVAADYVEFDPVFGWRHRPGARGRYGHGDYVINAQGLRDVERPRDAPAGRPRVLILGDSFAEGFSVPLEVSVSRATERALGKAGCAAEVVNGGTVGYSTDQEYLFYRDEGRRYGAQVVALLFYHNDILQNARAEAVSGTPKPLFTFAGGRPRILNAPLEKASPFRAAPIRYWRGSALLTWVRTRLRDGAPRAYDALARLRLWSPLRPGDVPMELRVYEREAPQAVRDAWLHTGHLLGLLQREVQAQGANLLLVYVPARMEISRRDWEITLRRYLVDERAWERRGVVRQLEEMGRRRGIPVVDLTDPLFSVGEDAAAYLPRGGHWNGKGHAVAAREIAREIKTRGWLPCPVGAPGAGPGR